MEARTKYQSALTLCRPEHTKRRCDSCNAKSKYFVPYAQEINDGGWKKEPERNNEAISYHVGSGCFRTGDNKAIN